MQAAKKNPHAARLVAARSEKPSAPWGQAILRHEALRLLKEGRLAPSAILGNLLSASASPRLDAESLSAQPRPLPPEAARVVADALRRSRLPGADVPELLDELMGLAWRAKAPSERPASAPRAAKAASAPRAARPPAPATKAPVIVRRAPRLPNAPD